MRETPKSLKAYFLIVGFLTSVGMFLTIFESKILDLPFLIVTLLLGLVGGAYLGIGWKLEKLLRDKPHIPVRFATAAIILSALRLSPTGVLLNVYIWYQLRRMAREAAPEMESQVLE